MPRPRPKAAAPDPKRPEALSGILAAIREDPEDDTPRLVLADWLEEHGATPEERARGELIRLQFRPKHIPGLSCLPSLPSRTSRGLCWSPLGDEGVEALARLPALAHLGTLELARTNMTAAGARALAASPHLSHLTRLDVGRNTLA